MSVFAKQRLNAEFSLSSEFSSAANVLAKFCFLKKCKKKDNLGRRVLTSNSHILTLQKSTFEGVPKKEQCVFIAF